MPRVTRSRAAKAAGKDAEKEPAKETAVAKPKTTATKKKTTATKAIKRGLKNAMQMLTPTKRTKRGVAAKAKAPEPEEVHEESPEKEAPPKKQQKRQVHFEADETEVTEKPVLSMWKMQESCEGDYQIFKKKDLQSDAMIQSASAIIAQVLAENKRAVSTHNLHVIFVIMSWL